ncbi:uracil phosphoribosyltransferase [Paracrocinitomix mangrovi]|uniref:uracil phosphoribosyltransferase n=1 Tax=Paracrocinitomix mangrovi TaxID=2862509 RepID=UPI001C8EFBA3|nr:uracil phosphoribosyltransferase [Paracrocinitomix mangrovi]UKN01375.1 uracil phosphoribosyltransferase [Paracrocinitomix mangrovi]
MVHILSKENSVLQHFLAEIRDVNVQMDAMRFRKNMERISEVMAYEMSKSLHYKVDEVTTPLGKKEVHRIDEPIVVASILRAGLTMHNGVLNYFDHAENAFISAYREENEEGGQDIKVHVEYLASPDLTCKTLVIVDPMLATGTSLLLTLDAIRKNGNPKKIHVMCAIASQPAVDKLQAELPDNAEIWLADVDEKLNSKAYIVPGLGDAGDLAFGVKL